MSEEMLPIIGIVCALSSSCTSSISLLGGGGAAFAAWRARQSGAKSPVTWTPSPPPPRQQAPRRPRRKPRRRRKRIGKKIGRRFKKVGRKIGRSFKKVGRRFKKAFRRKSFKRIGRRFKKAFRRKSFKRIGRRFKKAFRRKKFKKIFKRRKPRFKIRRRCFSPETLIKLQNGETVMMMNLKLSDILINGSTVTATMQIRNENDPYYKIHSEDLNTDILVTGSHYIQSSGRFIRVSKFNGSVATQKIDPVVNCIITSDHKVPIGEYIFWDWEDQSVK